MIQLRVRNLEGRRPSFYTQMHRTKLTIAILQKKHYLDGIIHHMLINRKEFGLFRNSNFCIGLSLKMRKITNTSLHWQIDFIEKSLHYLVMPGYSFFFFLKWNYVGFV